MNTRIKLRHLTCFIEVARHRSVSRAARTLFLTQAAVSKTIAELEEILATPLFDRGARGVTLNRFGEVFLRHAERASAALRQGERSGGGGEDQRRRAHPIRRAFQRRRARCAVGGLRFHARQSVFDGANHDRIQLLPARLA